MAQAYAEWLASGPFDVGTTTRTALAPALAALRVGDSAAAAARTTGRRESQASGALMRVSPLGVFGHRMPPVELARLAWHDATLTHPHPVCGLASAVFAGGIARAVATGDDPAAIHAGMVEQARKLRPDDVAHSPAPPCSPEEWEPAARAVVETLTAARDRPPEMEPRKMGWVLVALGLAAYQLLHGDAFEDAIVDTVRRGGDSDTNGAIVGALLGAVHDRDAVPWSWRDRVLTCRPIRGLPGVHQPRPPESWQVDALVLAEALLGHEVAPGPA